MNLAPGSLLQPRWLLAACVLTLPMGAQAREATPQELEFFEKKIRPVLAENCYKCHSATAKKLKGELQLDSRPGWEEGGESGQVIIPGQPAQSLLISALHYDKFEMPPKKKLPAEVIADFEKWIEMGAPDPRSEKVTRVTKTEKESFDLDARKKIWSLQPVAEVTPPEVERNDWPRGDHDRFVLAELEKKGWQPAQPASRTSWIRRVTYDLTGLPPKPEDVRAFLEDPSADAHEKVVDRLLGSKHFGEQWARHWMDLVRYAETKAFEADYPMPNVYQYRDYLIRAFNADVPYDQFLKEAIAGDLLEPRTNPDTGINESVIGPGYLYLTDGQHGPPDIHMDEARIFDDMIDVVGKAFLSQTVACARCHDHKFDAITTNDYYSLYGVIASSRIDYGDINPPLQQEAARTKLREKKAQIRAALAGVVAKDMRQVRDDLRAVQEGKPETPQQKRWADALQKKPNEVTKALAALLAAPDEPALAAVWNSLREAAAPATTSASLGGLSRTQFGSWRASGRSFGDAPRPAGDFVIAASGEPVISSFAGGQPAAGHLASRFAGSLKSPDFIITGDSVSVRLKGKNLRVSLYVRHYELVGKGPTTGGTTKIINSDDWQTVRFGTNLWVGETAYIDVQHNGHEMGFNWSTEAHVDGAYVVLDSASNNAPLPPLPAAGPILGVSGAPPASPAAALDHLATRIRDLASAWRNGTLTMEQSDLLAALHESGVLDLKIGRSERLQQDLESYRKMQAELPAPTYVRTLSDGPGADEPVYIRGSHENLSTAPNPRHFLDGIDDTPFNQPGSGRLQWAEALVANQNPLTARVMVNRIWHHLFGRGIVASVDDFGHMGESPSHPEFLDHLAQEFLTDNWSIKSTIRKLVLSSTYRMSTQADPETLRVDPNNIYLQRMPVRRLQAESIRDTVLAVSGRLDPKFFGPSQGGDGGNRRSIYIQLKRRFMPEFLMTFDMPNATEPFGRRNITASPTQSLAMMNSGLVWQAAEQWANRIAGAGEKSFAERVDLAHREAYGRPATEAEVEWARGFLADHQISDEQAGAKNHQVWKQICHTMLNRKELIYLY